MLKNMSKAYKDLSGFNPSQSTLEFYQQYGEDYTEWFDKAEELFDYIETNFPLSKVHESKSQKYSKLMPALMSPFNLYFTKKNLETFGETIDNFYHLNSDGLRCDEFSDSHDKLHILFAGCSITFGDGLPIDLTWSKMVYKSISKQVPTSGYYNVAGPGFNHLDIYYQVFKYIELYGNPEYIFINFPDLERSIDSGIPIESLHSVIIPMHNALIQYAETNNIKLIMFSWDIHSFKGGAYLDQNPNFNDVFYQSPWLDPRQQTNNTLYQFAEKELQAHMMTFIKINKNNKFAKFMLRAFDIVHPGIAEHDFYYNFAYNIWRDLHGPV